MRSKTRRRTYGFLDAVITGDAATAQAMLAAGVSVEARNNEHGETALMLAVQFGRDAIVALLLDAGADVNATDATGRTPLMFARAKSVSTLLAAGAQINAQDDAGETALMKAAGSADIEKAEALLENGADRTLSDHDNRSAWDHANDLGVLILMELLEPAHRGV